MAVLELHRRCTEGDGGLANRAAQPAVRVALRGQHHIARLFVPRREGDVGVELDVDATGSSVQCGDFVDAIDLADEVFNRPVSTGSIYHAIRNELANLRVGSASTKTRHEVRGSGTNPGAKKEPAGRGQEHGSRRFG